MDLLSLVERLAATTTPDNPQARRFRDTVFAGLDEVAWVPLAPGGAEPRRARPRDLLLTGSAQLDDALLTTFPAEYLERRTGRRVPHPDLSASARAMLLDRRPVPPDEPWDELGRLLRPGAASPWPVGDEDDGFRALLDLVTQLQGLDRTRCDLLLTGLRGDPEARLLPVPQPSGGRRLYALPAPEGGVRGRSSALVMGRVRKTEVTLQPPTAMEVVFLRDGLLANEADGDRAKPLGVRPFTVDTVLDRLAAVQDAEGGEVVTFLWGLLGRERGHEFGTAAGARLAAILDPAQWFWCQPGRAERTESDRAKQRRQRRLADVRLPARDGTWRPAGTLALGQDWADWVEAWAPADQATALRTACHRALEQVAPDPSALLAPPEQVLALLPDLQGLEDEDPEDADGIAAYTTDEKPLDMDAAAAEQPAPPLGASRRLELDLVARQRERLAFLLRLGVWEVLPVQAHERREPQDARRPWADLREHLEPGIDDAPWNFEAGKWGGRAHGQVRVTEDFRFRWPLEQADPARRLATAALLEAGIGLYARLATAAASCRSCSDSGHGRHSVVYRTGVEDRGTSTLAVQLRRTAWVPTERAGETQPSGAVPEAAWWVESPPSSAGMATSPLRFLPLLLRESRTGPEMRRLAGITDLEHSTAGRLEALLHELCAGLAVNSRAGGRQALVGLHRLVYARLSELGDTGQEVLTRTGVLCELDGQLVHRNPAETRHDDDRFATYRRYFTGVVPFAVLARDKAPVARRLGLPPFEVRVQRQGDDKGTDVTAALADALADRVPELFAILVHHSLGAQTLEPTSNEFETRSRRLQALTVRQVDDLVLDVAVTGTDTRVVVGRGSVQDLYLDGSTTLNPVLYHDVTGSDWPRRLRSRLAGHVASLVENTAYTATFQLLLLAEDDAERERVLHDLGISAADVEEVRLRLGAVTETDRRVERAWYGALLAVLRKDDVIASPGADAAAELHAAGLPLAVVDAVRAAGGGRTARSDDGPVLRLLKEAGVDLHELQRLLLAAGDVGLEVRAAAQQLRHWKGLHGRHVVAVLAGAGVPEQTARARVDGCQPPLALALALDPAPAQVLEAVAVLLASAQLDVDVAALVADPVRELVRLGGAKSAAELDARVSALYVDEERRRVLARLAAAWRREAAFLGVLARTTRGEARSAVRAHAEVVAALLPLNPVMPTELQPAIGRVLPDLPGAQDLLSNLLTDAVTAAPPDRQALLTDLKGWLPTDLADPTEAALRAPVHELVRQVRDRVGRLSEAGLAPLTPLGLTAPRDRPARRPGPRAVQQTTVELSVSRRKKELGDEGESWALASVVQPLLALPAERRAAVLEQLEELLRRYAKGPAVEASLAHLPGACSPDADEEDLLVDLAGLLHVSRHGDGFGFDLLGWLAVRDGAEPQPVALEVKSSAQRGFLLSRNEWTTAQRFAAANEGDAYAVLVVQRGPAGAAPTQLDLLPDPTRLVQDSVLKLEADTYSVHYRVG